MAECRHYPFDLHSNPCVMWLIYLTVWLVCVKKGCTLYNPILIVREGWKIACKWESGHLTAGQSICVGKTNIKAVVQPVP